jgi:hypothetical protein
MIGWLRHWRSLSRTDKTKRVPQGKKKAKMNLDPNGGFFPPVGNQIEGGIRRVHVPQTQSQSPTGLMAD